ncbi:hypothetical protein [Microcystis phage Mwe-JY08]
MVDVLRQSGALEPRETPIQTAQSQVSAREMAGPGLALADAVGYVAEKLDEALVPANEAMGAAAVERGEDGTLSVRTLPVAFSRSARAYNNAAENGYLATVRQDIDKGLHDLRLKHEMDPDGFDKAATAFVRGATRGAPATLRSKLDLIGSSEATQHSRSLRTAKQNLDLRNSKVALTARRSGLIEDMTVLAEQGGTDTPEFKAKAAELSSLQDTLSGNPLFGYPKELREVEDKRAMEAFKAEAIMGVGRRMFLETGDQEKTARFLDEALSEPGLNLTMEQRDAYKATAMRRVGTANAMRQEQAREFLNEARNLDEAYRRGEKLDDARVDAVVENLRRLKQFRQAETLEAAREVARLAPIIESGTPEQRRDALASLRARATGGGSVVDRIVNAESAGRSDARNPNSTATGAGQFIESTWLTMIKTNRPDLAAGKSDAEILALRTNSALSREMTARYAQDNAARLRDAGLPVTDGTVYLSHFAGSAGARALLRADPNADAATVMSQASGGRTSREALIKANPFLANMTAGGAIAWAERKMGGAGGGSSVYDTPVWAETVKRVQASYDAKVREIWEPIKQAYSDGVKPTAQEMEALTTMVPLSSDAKLREEIRATIEAEARGAALGNMTAPDLRAALDAAEQAAQAGGLGPADRELRKQAEAHLKSVETTLKDDPLARARVDAYARELGPEAVKSVEPLRVGAPDMVTAQLQQREKVARFVSRMDGVEIPSLLRPGDVAAVRQALQQGDGAAVSAFFAGFQAMPDDVVFATLAGKSMKDIIEGLPNTTDPGKFIAAMSGLDQLYARSPDRFRAAFGEDAVRKLQNYQAGVAFDRPEDIAKRLARREDGGQSQIRVELERQADGLAKDLTTSEIAGALPSAPTFGDALSDDPNVNRALAADYRRLFRERFVETNGDADLAKKQATERLGQVWKVSPANGGKIMRFAPEAAYPAIGGSHEWIGKQIQEALRERVYGRPWDTADPGLAAEMPLQQSAPAESAAVIPPQLGTRGMEGPERDLMGDAPREVMALPVGAAASPSVRQPAIPGDPIKYTIVPTRQTESDLAAGRPPEYRIVYSDPRTGLMVDLPRVRFDPAKAMAPARQTFERDVARAQDTRAGLRAMDEAARAPLDLLNRQREQ